MNNNFVHFFEDGAILKIGTMIVPISKENMQVNRYCLIIGHIAVLNSDFHGKVIKINGVFLGIKYRVTVKSCFTLHYVHNYSF